MNNSQKCFDTVSRRGTVMVTDKNSVVETRIWQQMTSNFKSCFVTVVLLKYFNAVSECLISPKFNFYNGLE